jgi:DNA replication protein DnaC
VSRMDGNPAEKRDATCEEHGPFIAKQVHGMCTEWTECPKCLERTDTCDKHGKFVTKHEGLGGFFEHWTRCPTCAAERDREFKESEKRRIRAELIDQQVKAAGIPVRFYSKTLSDYKATVEGERRALSVANDYIEEFAAHLAVGRCLVFCGLPGTGKTHLACAIAHGLARRGRSTRYLTVAELIRSIRDTWQRNSFNTTAVVLRRLRELDLLVLDEVGVQFGTEAEITQLTEVMDMRYRDTKPTLVISNCAIGDLKQYLGDRIVDRLMENGGKVVIFNWPSRRV